MYPVQTTWKSGSKPCLERRGRFRGNPPILQVKADISVVNPPSVSAEIHSSGGISRNLDTSSFRDPFSQRCAEPGSAHEAPRMETSSVCTSHGARCHIAALPQSGKISVEEVGKLHFRLDFATSTLPNRSNKILSKSTHPSLHRAPNPQRPSSISVEAC